MKFGTSIGSQGICIFHDKYFSQVKSYRYDDDAELRVYIRKMLLIGYVKL